MDLEILEALALSDDRAAALRQLLPGSEDHDYYSCLHAQHRGALDEAETILEAWSGRHGTTERLERLRLRQLLYRLGVDPEEVADDARDHFGVSHWHEPAADEVDPSRPTRLPDGVFDGARLLREAAYNYSTDLSQVTDDGIDELLRDPESLKSCRSTAGAASSRRSPRCSASSMARRRPSSIRSRASSNRPSSRRSNRHSTSPSTATA